MKIKNDGGPAFPFDVTISKAHPEFGRVEMEGGAGMSLRDWFAGQALLGLIRNVPFGGGSKEILKATAKSSYLYADAMLEERGKQ